ncbi:TPA: nucleotide exchange factor GrpE [Candidatus Berkelbacteria bacterium]|uniref:Protein GrpE n=1 Tax=Berkelbacteria bacterium GW2011_GWE1_39_12 TaxID=1618337 RepID=A0A0G4B3A9_9BACT|nr:MAG: molecular chaperone GrpE (heat shock protein), molecular chaperone GrpE [Berkelbacteria bacterium GW2011_GWE1_39_12]HBO61028.1 nucleotide exchange factor GrpE [Candidatus Berkelbacteria bacterium]
MTKKNLKNDPKDQKDNNLEEKIIELENGWKRTQADFDNYVKRSEDQKLNIIKAANTDLMMEIVPVLDNFRRAFLHAPNSPAGEDNFTLGIKQIEKQLEEILTAEGLKKIETTGELFNPAKHEAISYEENELPADSIIAEAESGWEFNGKVLKPAKVRVSKGK